MSCNIPGSMCVGVTVWFVWGGVVSEYTQETFSETHYTLENARTIEHRSNNIYRNTLVKTTTHVTTNHSPLNKDANAKTSILTEQYDP